MLAHRRILRSLFGITLVLFAGGFFAGHAQAAAEIAILSPSPNGVYLKETNIAFELQITSDLVTGYYKIGWDFDDTDDGGAGGLYPPADESPCLQLSAPFTYPIRYPSLTNLRVNHLYPGITVTDGEHIVKVRLRKSNQQLDCGPTFTDVETQQILYLTDDLRFTGYSWLGASTSENSPDAQGWTSFNCANLGSCDDPAALLNSYSVQAIHSDESPDFCKIQNAGWLGGVSSTETGAKPVGWLTFNKGTCISAGKEGVACATDADCDGNPGSCAMTKLSTETTTPGWELDLEENWQSAREYVHMYSSYATVDSVARVPGQISGWGRFLTLREYGTQQLPQARNDWGWVHLRGPAVPTTPGIGLYQECTDCSSGNFKCNSCNGYLDGATLKRYACNSCYGTPTAANPTGMCATESGNVKCDACDVCNLYGVSYDAQQTQLTGFAWSGGQSGDQNGFGWMEFDPAQGGVSILQAWLATRFGDIFVGGNITAGPLRASPASQYNATYVIQADGSIAFTSRIGQLQPDYPRPIPLPSRETRYINVLGRLNLDEMEKIGPNRFGTTVDILTEQPGRTLSDYLATQTSLGGRIFYYNDDVTVDTELVLPANAGEGGAGTFIIDGNLTINADITYSSLTPGSLIELPSVSWIVLGDVKISPDVGSDAGTSASPNIVGAFLVLGKEDGSPTGLCDVAGQPPETVSGVVCTGTRASQIVNDLELIVSGMMMARKFKFERKVISPQGSEQIVYDGRLIANPPPGLQDLSAVLPAIRDVAP